MSNELRRAQHEELLAATAALLERVPDEEALSIYRFIVNNGVPASMDRDGLQSMGPIMTNDWFLILHVLPGDEEMFPGLATISTAGAAHFDWNNRRMVFRRPDPYTMLWRSVLLLHEGHHARSLFTNPRDPTDIDLHMREERDTHALQNRIVARYAGRQYREYIDQEAKRQRRLILKKGGLPGADFIVPDISQTTLDRFLGPALSEAERNSRRMHAVIHIGFRVIELYWKGDIPTQQTNFYQGIVRLNREVAAEGGQQ